MREAFHRRMLIWRSGSKRSPRAIRRGGPGSPGEVGGQRFLLRGVLNIVGRKRPRGYDAPLVRRELRQGFAVPPGRDRVQGHLTEPMQVLRAVIGTQVGPMAPQAPVLHETVLEEDLLARLDVGSGKQHRSCCIRDLLRDGWSVRVGQDRDNR